MGSRASAATVHDDSQTAYWQFAHSMLGKWEAVDAPTTAVVFILSNRLPAKDEFGIRRRGPTFAYIDCRAMAR